MATILILPNDEIESLIGVLAEGGHTVIEAHDSGEVLQRVMRAGLDAVVLPDAAELTDGQEMLPVVRRLTSAVIVVVGEGDEVKMANALFLGADAYLQYPDEPNRVRSRLRALLRPRRARRPLEITPDVAPGGRGFYPFRLLFLTAGGSALRA